jgi:hypothetical protein
MDENKFATNVGEFLWKFDPSPTWKLLLPPQQNASASDDIAHECIYPFAIERTPDVKVTTDVTSVMK